jgi:chromosome partitioning protein
MAMIQGSAWPGSWMMPMWVRARLAVSSTTSYLDIMGIPLLLNTIDKIRKRGNPGLTVLGVLPTMYNPRYTQDRETLADLTRTLAGRTRVFEPVNRATDFEKAAAANQPLPDALPDTPGVTPYLHLVQELCAYVA